MKSYLLTRCIYEQLGFHLSNDVICNINVPGDSCISGCNDIWVVMMSINQIKRQRFHIRLSLDEYLLLKEKAAFRGKRMSEYVRFLVKRDVIQGLK